MKSNKNIHRMVFLLLLSFGLSLGTLNSSHILIQDIENMNNPKSSAGEITIITPKDITYTGPNNGFYPATYGFENDVNGSLPEGWLVNMTSATPVFVQSSYGSHTKVIHFNDDSDTSYPSMAKFISQQPSSGTIEFWILVTDSSKITRVDFWGPSTNFLKLVVDNSNFRAYDSTWRDLTTCNNDTWYRIRLDFETTTNGYQGLLQNQYHLYINDTLYGNYGMPDTDYLYIMNFKTYKWDSGYHTYIDAIGFSWDPGYNVGDNSKEGLLLSYENTTNLEWKGYSLDGQANKTILGNTTIPMPENGLHSIQVFGNSSLGTIYQSDLRYFSVGSGPEDIEEWQYFREVNLNPSTPESDYQIKVQLNNLNFNYSKANHDGSDIRFLDQSQKQLSYWIEKWDNTSTSIIWVKIPTSGTSKFYMYYGNPNAFSLSNGTNTFIFFDDFGGTSLDLSKWDTEIGSYCGITVSNGYVRVYSATSSAFVEFAEVGFSDFEGQQGVPYSGYYTNGHARARPSTDTSWFTGEIRILNSTYAPFYKNDIFDSADTDPRIGPLPARFLSHSAISGPGSPYWAYISSINATLGIDNRAIRFLSWVDLEGIADYRMDWVFVFKYNELNPSVTLGLENKIGLEIIIYAPIAYSLYGTLPPLFNINITDPDFDFTWYSLDGGFTNVYSNEILGTIDQTEWDKFGNGTVTITFYANDTAGNIVQAQTIVRKDTISPIITINEPVVAQQFDYTPIFDISISEANLDEFWYTIDNGATNFTISSLSGIISQAAWNAAADGPVIIRFYAKDLAGNIGTASVIVAKIPSEVPTPPPGISGYDIYLLLGVFGIISAVIIRKRLKS